MWASREHRLRAPLCHECRLTLHVGRLRIARRTVSQAPLARALLVVRIIGFVARADG